MDVQGFIKIAAQHFHQRRKRDSSRHLSLLQDIRWSKIGNGHYGEAWTHPDHPGLVLKISGPSGWGLSQKAVLDSMDFRNADKPGGDAWPVFARHCQAHPHPNLPNVMHFEQFSQSFAWAVMPLYDDFGYDGAYISQYRHWNDVLNGAASGADWMWPLVQMGESLQFQVDLHAANVMIDSVNNQLILTDPFSMPGQTYE